MPQRALLPALIAACAAACDASPSPTDAWAGRWNGPEGTYLAIAGAGGVYQITIKDLDAARTFNGKAVGERIEFRRDGKAESIAATTGDATGMKWLAGKTNCLTIKAGEGYCRD